MKKQSNFYLMQVGNNAMSWGGNGFNLDTTNMFDLETFCGFKSKEDLHNIAKLYGIYDYKVLSVNTTSVFEEVL